jgi:streptogramin lyase
MCRLLVLAFALLALALALPAGASAFIATGGGAPVWQDTLPQGDSLNAVAFSDAAHGWVVADGGAGLATAGGSRRPTVRGFAPASGPVGTVVTVIGTGFSGATAVALVHAAAAFTVDSDTQITLTVPAGAISGPISVTTPRGAARSAAAFRVVGAGPATLRITAPTGYRMHTVGDTLDVAWTSDRALGCGEFAVWARSSTGTLYLGDVVPAAGGTSFTRGLVLDVPAGTGYQVVVAYRPMPGVGSWQSWATSPGSFWVSGARPLTLRVTAPTGFATYMVGDTLEVAWTSDRALSCGEFGIWAGVGAGVRYLGDVVPAYGTSSTHRLVLDVPIGTGYQVVVAYRPIPGVGIWQSCATSPGSFRVSGARPPTLRVTAPTGHRRHAVGDTLDVAWTSDRALGSGEFAVWARSRLGVRYLGDVVPAAGGTSSRHGLVLNLPVGTGYQVIVAYRATPGTGSWGSLATSPGLFDVTQGSTPAIGDVTEFPVSENSGPLDIVAGPDGNLYFSASTNHAIGLITTSGTVTLYGTMDDPNGLAFDGLGNLWFTMLYPSSQDLGMWALPLSTSTLPRYWDIPYPGEEGGRPAAMALGPDGCIWYTQPAMSRVGSVDPSGPASQTPASYLLSGGLAPKDITAGSDGGMWYTAAGSSQIGRLSTTGAQSYFTVVSSGSSNPVGIASGPDGNLWITNEGNNSIQQVTPAGVVATFAIPTAASGPMGIAAGPDGNLWFVENAANQIGRITTAGVITEYPIPSADSNAIAITAGPDGNMWFTEEGDFTITDPTGDKIGRIITGVSAGGG